MYLVTYILKYEDHIVFFDNIYDDTGEIILITI